MPDDTASACGPSTAGRQVRADVPTWPAGPRGLTRKEALVRGFWKGNPVSTQLLGICSALAVTNRFENALVMGSALVFVTAMSNLAVSLMRSTVPRRIRLMAEVAVIATFVIVFDQLLEAYYWEMSKQLGPYVGLIITNCIVMGRAEAFALHNPPLLSVVDGLANGAGYAAVLGVIGFSRELLGTGRVLLIEKLFGVPLDVSAWLVPNQVMILAPGAFVGLGFLVAAFNLAGGAGRQVRADVPTQPAGRQVRADVPTWPAGREGSRP